MRTLALFSLVTLLSLTSCDPPLSRIATGYECSSPCRGSTMCCPVGTTLTCVPADDTGTCALPNLTVNGARASSSAYVEWRYFAQDDCALLEGCVGAPGWRRLLSFATETPNVGDGDLVLGPPRASDPDFVFSPCHGHYHFDGYASYALVDGVGGVVASGHKQAFCLEDYEPLPGSTAPFRYSCLDQGISAGWADTYDVGLDCQWIDVTDVVPGDYRIRIRVNEAHKLYESSYDDDEALASTTVPTEPTGVDVTASCPSHRRGPFRDCGFYEPGLVRTCTPGSTLEVRCRADIGATCLEDVVFRVCEGTTPCISRDSMPPRDWQCRLDPVANPLFECPPSGQYVLLEGPFDSDGPLGSCPEPVILEH